LEKEEKIRAREGRNEIIAQRKRRALIRRELG
jgi:hypothetical protein